MKKLEPAFTGSSPSASRADNANAMFNFNIYHEFVKEGSNA